MRRTNAVPSMSITATRRRGRLLVPALALAAVAALPAAAQADTEVRVLTGSNGGVDQRGVVEMRYDTATRATLAWDPGATSGAGDDTIRVDALDGVTDLAPGPGCHAETATRVRCDGVLSPLTRLTVVRAASVRATGGATDDVIRLDGLLASRATPLIVTGGGDDLVDLSRADGRAGLQAEPFGDRFQVDAGAGDDEVIGGSRAITAALGAGDDIVRPKRNQPSEALGSNGIDQLDGGSGRDVLHQAGRLRALTIDLAAGTSSAAGIFGGLESRLAGIEDVVGSGLDDVITGNSGPNRLLGGDGRDTILGLGGDDRLGAFDHLVPPAAPPGFDPDAADTDRDRLDGGAGADTLDVAGDGLADTADCGTDGTRTQTEIVGGRPVTFSIHVGDTVHADAADDLGGCETVL